mmetsp:Transcript_107939/g.286021  ORF Transcript_107939/g.286021 Transcript_107939/m.286021 type:complete len:295 (-) Transcript_107939:42-926(-)
MPKCLNLGSERHAYKCPPMSSCYSCLLLQLVLDGLVLLLRPAILRGRLLLGDHRVVLLQGHVHVHAGVVFGLAVLVNGPLLLVAHQTLQAVGHQVRGLADGWSRVLLGVRVDDLPVILELHDHLELVVAHGPRRGLLHNINLAIRCLLELNVRRLADVEVLVLLEACVDFADHAFLALQRVNDLICDPLPGRGVLLQVLAVREVRVQVDFVREAPVGLRLRFLNLDHGLLPGLLHGALGQVAAGARRAGHGERTMQGDPCDARQQGHGRDQGTVAAHRAEGRHRHLGASSKKLC